MPLQTTDLDVTSGYACSFSAPNQNYTIAAGVVVDIESTADGGVQDTATGNDAFVNYGSLVDYKSFAVFINPGAFAADKIYNAAGASIYSYKTAVYVAQSSGTQINNDGTITGEKDGIFILDGLDSVYNTGSIFGSDNGIYSNNNLSVINSGTITAQGYFADYGIDAGWDDTGGIQKSTIRNTGTITSDYAAVGSYGSGSLTLFNSGKLEGDVSVTNSGGDSIRNKGEIDGNVKLGNGTNTFDGRGGSVDGGYIAGGTGVDTVHLGNDGESVNSGAGHDTLYAGAGNDTFAYTSYAAANSDTIFGFNVTNDTVQLNHAQFTKLTKGATPAFSIGSAASSATDYLFYNSSTGGLYYDPDGNGSGAANLLAKLDPGLKMTAHDFKVI